MCVSPTWVRFSGKCVLGTFVFRNYKSITMKLIWAGQDLACSQEKKLKVVFIFKLYGHCIGPNHGLAMAFTLIASRWSRPQSQYY